MSNQIFSRFTYTGDGVTETFAVPFPYLSKEHVKVEYLGVPVVFYWETPSTVRPAIVPESGTFLTVYRETPRDHRIVDFSDASMLTAKDLDTSALQSFFLQQELLDIYRLTFGDALVDADGNLITTPYNEIIDQMVDQIVNSELYTFLGEKIDRIDAVEILANSNLSTNDTQDLTITNMVTEDETLGEAVIQNLYLQNQTIEGNRNNQALIYEEQTVRANADEALASDITLLSARVGTNEADILNEQTVRADADTALASDITTLETTVGDNTALIQTNATSIDGVNAKYTVKIDLNGYVTGYGLIASANDGTPTSQFIVRADQFAVGSPGKADKVPFIIDTGTGLIAIDGNLMVSGSIAASALNVSQLSAIAADMGLVTAGTYRTKASDSGYRFEISSTGSYPMWYGSGSKTAGNAKFYTDTSGNAFYKGQLNVNNQFTVDANGHVDAKSVTLRKPDGTVMFDTGTGLASSYVTGLGAFAGLSQLTAANISTYMSTAAIGSAYIQDLHVSKLSGDILEAAYRVQQDIEYVTTPVPSTWYTIETVNVPSDPLIDRDVIFFGFKERVQVFLDSPTSYDLELRILEVETGAQYGYIVMHWDNGGSGTGSNSYRTFDEEVEAVVRMPKGTSRTYRIQGRFRYTGNFYNFSSIRKLTGTRIVFLQKAGTQTITFS